MDRVHPFRPRRYVTLSACYRSSTHFSGPTYPPRPSAGCASSLPHLLDRDIGSGLARTTAPGAHRVNRCDTRATGGRPMTSIPRPPGGHHGPCSDPSRQSIRDARSGFEAVTSIQSSLHFPAGVARKHPVQSRMPKRPVVGRLSTAVDPSATADEPDPEARRHRCHEPNHGRHARTVTEEARHAVMRVTVEAGGGGGRQASCRAVPCRSPSSGPSRSFPAV